ncbi:beta-glucosidase [Sphaerisporangium rufum]|uniref:Beta-glucosidase n=1 Tax=Sphaerisporangium rufum TaxID=1381558 RepID=A0A919QZ08_9ACTN|nr:family 1 glycosylhydrolase [Sphaerisporangium rufum]GII76794.1 beta-glucosidase [Sphaerisporangium rufum]
MRWHEDGRLRFAVGIEDTFVPQEYPGRRRLDEYELTQHYHLWHQDLGLAAATGAEMIRWGIPWYRVEPEPGRFRWDWLDRVVDRLVELELTCVVDLMHYGTPMWLDNQFLNAGYPARVAEYAARVAERYRDRLHVWTPLNEPTINAVYCGENGTWPPHLTGQDGFVKLALAIARGITATQRAVAAVQPEATFVHVEASFRYAGDSFPFDVDLIRERRYLIMDLVTGKVDAGHPLHGYLLGNGAGEAELAELRAGAVVPDVVGVNYYPAFTTSRYEPGSAVPVPVEAGTAGLAELLGEFAARYGRPLFVTETSRAGTPAERVAWLRDSVALIRRMREEGTPIVGYTWWPLFALVDWLYRESAEPVERWLVQMGLYDLEPDGAGVLRRVPTAAVEEFRRLAR